MPKQGQRDNDAGGPTGGRNNPKQSTPVTAGTPKKRETYEQQAREGKNTDPEPQRSKPSKPSRDHRDGENTRIDSPASGRSGSDSNAS